jgi:HSP20 family molecular chaperone IbpA
MAIIRWDPYRDMVTLRDRMNRLFEDMGSQKTEDKDLIPGAWAPSVDIYETENEVVLAAEIPGVDEKDVEIKVEDNNLTLRGERFEGDQETTTASVLRSFPSFALLTTSIRLDRGRAQNGVPGLGCPSGRLKPRKSNPSPVAAPAKPKSKAGFFVLFSNQAARDVTRRSRPWVNRRGRSLGRPLPVGDTRRGGAGEISSESFRYLSPVTCIFTGLLASLTSFASV